MSHVRGYERRQVQTLFVPTADPSASPLVSTSLKSLGESVVLGEVTRLDQGEENRDATRSKGHRY